MMAVGRKCCGSFSSGLQPFEERLTERRRREWAQRVKESDGMIKKLV